ncbi:hypothetical protein D6D05_00774 [Aureobasidium pullulans]|nr:hypothetical protein D6D05_00774 [Aureobasidium pullulans]
MLTPTLNQSLKGPNMVSRNTLSSAGPSVRKNKDDIDPSKSFILTLPTELLTMNLDNLKQVDLGMVRRTCKTLCGIATVVFARKIATTLRLDFSKEDMDRLVGLTGHPVFGPMLKSISFSTAQYNEIRHPYLEDEYPSKHGSENGPTFVRDVPESLWPFGISTIPVEESYSATMEAIGNAVELSRFEVRRVNIYLETHHKDHEEIFTSNKFWRTIQSNLEQVQTYDDRSQSGDQQIDYLLRQTALSEQEIWDMIYQDKYREICLKNCDAHYCVLSEFIGTTMSKVKHLELHRINILQSPYPQENGMPKATGITFCQCLQKLQNLESLKLYEIKNRAIGSIQSEQVHWEGQEQIQADLNDLIGKMTTWEWNQ